MEAGLQLSIEDLVELEQVDGDTGADPRLGAGALEEAKRPGAGEASGGVVLTDEQERAVSRRAEPLLLSAAAGSGKTAVLVERFVRAVREDGHPVGRILAITFTERAAGELRERVRARLLELGEREAARDVAGAYVGTFHGFCARLLRVHALLAELEPGFSILEEGLAGRLRGEAFSLALRAFVQGERADAVDLLGAYGVERVRAMVVGAHEQLRSRGRRLPRLPTPAPSPEPRLWSGEDDADAVAVCILLDELLASYGAAYERLKRERGAVDFDDLELCALRLLDEHESVRTAWSRRFEMLMVDELQDSNPRQLAILAALDRENLFTVGDEQQSIYGFRHADVSLFRARRAALERRDASLALRRNFRARAPLLAVVNALFANRLPDFVPLVAGRAESDGGDSPVDLLLSARSGWEGELAARVAEGLPLAPTWRQAEARMLAEHVAGLVREEGVRPGEVVVLLRALGDVEVYERALQMCGLRTLAAVGAFWEHQQVGDMLAYLRVLANPLDEEALYSTLASPLAGLSRDGLALLARAAREAGKSAWETALGEAPTMPADDREALAGFCAQMREERAQAPRRTVAELIERAVAHNGYREHVLSLPAPERRLANLDKLMRLARRFEASEGRDLRAFLDHASHLREHAGGEAHAPVDAARGDAVQLMSIHAAKGLEFPVVCIADLGRVPNARMPDLLLDGERMGLQLVRMDGAKATPTLDFERLSEERRRAEAEEEQRIMYVAMTRARERLVLSGAVDFTRWGQAREGSAPIAWLGPALAADVPASVVQGQPREVPGEALDGRTREGRGDAVRERTGAGTGAAAHFVRVDGTSVRCFCNVPANTTVGRPAGGETGPTAIARALAGHRERPRPRSTPSAARARSHDRPHASPSSQEDHPHGTPSSKEDRPHTTPSPQAPLPDPLSYTALSELERCGYRFYLERVLGLREVRASAGERVDEESRLEARERGRLVHLLLEGVDFAAAAAVAPEQVARAADVLGLSVSAQEREEIAALLSAASASTLAARVARASQVRRERPFAFVLEAAHGRLFTGVIDLLASESDGGVLVLDYKSDRVAAQADLGRLVERDYALQRLLYALAVLRDGAAHVDVVHWFLARPRDPVSARFEARERVGLEARLALLLSRVGDDPFAVSARPHRGLCLTCPGRVALCSWGERETSREDPPD